MLSSDVQTHMTRLKAKRKSFAEGGQTAEAQKLLPFYVRIMTKVADCERCSVFIHDPGQNKIWLKAGTGVDERGIEVLKESSIVGEVISSGKAKIVTTADQASHGQKVAEEKTGFVTRNILCVPIKSTARNEVSGAFQLLNKVDGQEFTNDDLSLASEVAEHLQKEVDAIFLDQEIFGLTERLYTTLRKTTMFFLASLAVLFLGIVALLVLWVAAPAILG